MTNRSDPINHPEPQRSQVEAELEALDRSPFRRLTAKHLQAAFDVDPKHLREFAAKSPDRLAQSIAIYARHAGYSDKLELSASEGTIAALLELSDSELRIELLRAVRDIRATLPAAALPVEPPPGLQTQGTS